MRLPRPSAVVLATLILAALAALLSTGAAAQPRPGALALFDSFRGATSGASVAGHSPELPYAGPWRVDGPGAPPVTQAGTLLFPAPPAGTTGPSAIAVVAAPTGDRTVHTTVFQPAGHTASVVARVHVRYQDAGHGLAVVVRWPASSGTVGAPVPDALVSLDRTDAGQPVSSLPIGTVPHTVYARDLPVVVRTAGPLVEVWIDGLRIGAATSNAYPAAPDVAFSAETPPHPNGGAYARLTGVVVTTVTPPSASVCPGLAGVAAQACLRAGYAPLRTYAYDEALGRLFATIAATGAGLATRTVEGVYGGATAEWSPGVALSPDRQVTADGFTAEHVWPRARGAQTGASTDGPAHNDLHTLAPAYGSFRSARGERAYGDAFDPATQTARWLRGRTTRYPSEGPPSSPGTYSRVERDRTDAGAPLGGLGRFDVRHARRGDVARQAAYFLALYRIEAEDGADGRAFIMAMLDVLLRWHRADPVDDAERARDDQAFLAQGNHNPFVLDSSLVRRVFYSEGDAPAAASVWINEVHHTNDGLDVGEGVEIAGPAGTDLYGYRLWTYSGFGDLYTVDPDGADGPSVALRTVIDDEGGAGPTTTGIGAVWTPIERLRGGCQGLALTDPAGRLVEFVSTGGCQFNALSGPVYDLAVVRGAGAPAHPDSLVWSMGIAGPRPAAGGPPLRVQEWSTMPAGYSLQRSGAGRARDDFHWAGPFPASPGRLNDYQAPSAAPGSAPLAHRVSGWHAGLPVPDGLLAPLTDAGRDEDSSDGARPADGAPSLADRTPLRLGLPSPNPARHLVRFVLDAPLNVHISAEVTDALGRTVLRLAPAPGMLALDVSRLAAGIYTLRVAEGQESVSSRFTVAP